MNKMLIGAAVLIVGLALFLGVWQLLPARNPQSGTTVSQETPIEQYFPDGTEPPLEVVGGETVLLPVASDEVPVRNFLRDSDVLMDDANPGFYYLGTDAIAELGTREAFTIQYIAQTGYFTVTLLQRPFASVRLQAERTLIARLGISRAQLCDLRYTVAIPGFIDAAASGIDYRFSHCPDALPLPTDL
jgi:hypothetical protein